MLTTAKIDATPAPQSGKRKLFDSDGLFLLISSNGKRGWRYKFRFGGRESLLSFGPYPDVPIEVAREQARAAREQLKRGENPAALKRKEREAKLEHEARTFGRVGAEYLAHDDTKARKTQETHTRQYQHLKKIHNRPLESITTQELVQLCRVLEAQGKRETAHRVASFADRVFRFAAQSGYTSHNPARDMRGALKPVAVKSRAGITTPESFGAMMLLIDGDALNPFAHATVRCALRFIARVFVRPGELRMAEWSEFYDLNGETPEWRIPAHKMKMPRPHVVPLAPACVALLKAQRQVSGEGRYVFPNARSGSRPMSDGALGAALKTLFYDSSEHVPHGFRVTASTLLNEQGFDSALIELQLAHARKDQVAGVYDRSQRLPERRAMMIAWCDYIEELKKKHAPKR